MKKKAYMKPAMQVVALNQHSPLLAGSGPVKSVSNDDGFGWSNGGFGDSEDDR